MKDMEKDYSNRILTLPNILSFIRLGAVPVFIVIFFVFYESIPYLAGVVFACIALTDVVDGYIARKFNMISEAGKVLDPLADKVAQLAAITCLVIKGNVHWIFVVIMLAKELYMICYGIILYNRQFVLGAKTIGKVSSLVINVAVFLTFFKNMGEAGEIVHTVATIMLICGLLLSLIAVAYYTVLVYKQTGGHLPPKKEKVKKD